MKKTSKKSKARNSNNANTVLNEVGGAVKYKYLCGWYKIKAPKLTWTFMKVKGLNGKEYNEWISNEGLEIVQYPKGRFYLGVRLHNVGTFKTLARAKIVAELIYKV